MARRRRRKARLLALLKFLENDLAVVAVLVVGVTVLGAVGVTISWPVAIIVALLFVAFVLLLRIVIIPQLLSPETGRDGMLGLEGEVVITLNPVGLVRVNGEHWKATTTSGNIEKGNKVEVVGIEGLTLRVSLQ